MWRVCHNGSSLYRLTQGVLWWWLVKVVVGRMGAVLGILWRNVIIVVGHAASSNAEGNAAQNGRDHTEQEQSDAATYSDSDGSRRKGVACW